MSAEYRATEVPDGLHDTRADAGLSRLLGLSRTHVTEAIEAGGAIMNGAVLGKSDRLVAGAHLEVTWQPRREARVEPVAVPDLRIVFDDEHIVVVDKPAGVAAHPSVGWTGPTVLGALAAAGYRISTSGVPERQGIVHRLDVGTSGLMVVAKSEHAYTMLKRAFRDREVHKIYHTIVQGHPDPLSGTIDAPIGRHPGSAWRFAVTRDGKPSITHYTTLEAFVRATLLEVELETGRTHQIRVHFSAQHHPCIGDLTYGADPTIAARFGLDRQWLHAKQLSFAHPATGETVVFESPYPEDLERSLEMLRDGD